MKEKALSIIIPVYNVEKYLEQCVRSIVDQITPDVEVILVDDGSTDSSGKMCDSFAELFEEIEVVHQPNGGLAAARNTGLAHVHGNYIAFIDSDDYLAENCIAKILRWISFGGTDICFMRAMKFFPDGRRQLLDGEMNADRLKESKESAIKYLSECSKYPGSPCTKLFKRSLLENNHLRFPDDRRVSEDLGFVLQCILDAKTYDTLPIDYYYYRQAREGSITNKVTYKSFLGLKAFVKEAVDILMKDGVFREHINQYVMSFVAYEYSIMVWQYGFLKQDEKCAAYDFLKEYQWVLKYGRSSKTHFVKKVMDIFGIRATAAAMKIYMQLRK